MQKKEERPPILDKCEKRGTSTVARPVPDIVSHRLTVTEEEPEGYDPYDKPPPVVTTAHLDVSMSRRRRTKPRT